MKASAGHQGANTSLHNLSRPKVPQLRRVPIVGAELDTSLRRITITKTFKRGYMLAGLTVLLLTSLLWALLGARLQNNNADQLADSYLFESWKTFHAAQFPGQHTFLLKWPLFWLHNAIGTNVASFEIFTIIVVLLTVGGLAYLLWRIERRPVMLGTIYLALASVLLVIPAVPYPGALLPTNMAMLTTRNIEYLAYISALLLCIRARGVLSWSMLAAAAVFGVLFVSDRLFASLSLGGALLMWVVYVATHRQILRVTAQRWLAASVGGVILAAAAVAVTRHYAWTGFMNQDRTSPFALAHGLHDVALGGVYVVLGMLTNFGANPGHGVLTLREVPAAFRAELISPALPAYIVNLGLLALCIIATVHVVRLSFAKVKLSKRSKKPPVEVASSGLSLAVMLVASSISAAAAYMLTSHSYVVDSRYLTIFTFGLFVCLAVYSRSRNWRSIYVIAGGAVIFVGILCGLYFAVHNYQANRDALQRIQTRNVLITQALRHHNESVLVGDYWRVLPIRLDSAHNQRILPLTTCTIPRADLSSAAWQVNLQNHSFAYLLSLDTAGVNFAACNLSQVTAAYGQPNAMTVIAGTTDQPKEVLLFYDHGANHFKPSDAPSIVSGSGSSLAPVAVDKLLDVNCRRGSTLMQIVAHEDDDLLFMNPDLQHSIDAGDCVRTVYVTAGDAGSGKFYWLGREQGSEAAYAKLLGVPNSWLQQTVRIAPGEFATIASPTRNANVTLIFMHLPDGNLHGQGFASSTDEGLAKLQAGQIKTITSVDGQSTYTDSQLQNALRTLINVYSPDVLHTQLPQNASETYPDHSDHLAVGQFATEAFRMYQLTHPRAGLTYYMGYPVHDQPQNVSGSDLDRKEQVFFTYSRYDGSTCQTIDACAASGVYDIYLQRQYSQPADN